MITLEQAMIIAENAEKMAKKEKCTMSKEAMKNWEERCTSYGPCIIVEKSKKHKALK